MPWGESKEGIYGRNPDPRSLSKCLDSGCERVVTLVKGLGSQ